MKLDFQSWRKVPNPNGKNISPKGRLRLRVTPPAALYAEGVSPETGEVFEVLVGHSAEFDLRSDCEMTFRFVGADDAYVYDPFKELIVFDDDQEVFTNIDKMPLASEHLDAVQSALRLFKLETAHQTRLLRAERQALEAARSKPQGDAPVAVDPSVVTDPPVVSDPPADPAK